MHFKYLCLSFLFLLGGILPAQNAFHYKVGLNLTSHYGSAQLTPLLISDFGDFNLNKNEYKIKPRFLWTSGFFWQRTLNATWSFQTGINYSARGFNLLHDLEGSKTGFSIKNSYSSSLILHYIDIPVLGGFQFKENVYLLAGIQPSFLMHAKSKNKQTFKFYNNAGDLIAEEVFSNASSSELGPYARFDLVTSLGIEYKFLPRIMIGAQALIGARKIYRDGTKLRSMTLQFTVSYTLRSDEFDDSNYD